MQLSTKKFWSLWITMLFTSLIFSGLVSYAITSICSRDESSTTFAPLMAYQTDSIHRPSRGLVIQPDLTQAAANGVKSVVDIQVRKISQLNAWQSFLNRLGIYRRENNRTGGGSGVIISTDGLIVTNRHVIRNTDVIKVTLGDSRMFMASVIGYDRMTDMALLKIDTVDLPTLPWGNSDDLQVGEWVLAIGNPYGLQNTVTVGIVSSKEREIRQYSNQPGIYPYIQTDATISAGNSGGALINARGELMGIPGLMKSISGHPEGYSFVTPSNLVRHIVDQIQTYGAVSYAAFGMSFREITDSCSISKPHKESYVRVFQVEPEGIACKAGVHIGDTIIQIGSFEGVSSSVLLDAAANSKLEKRLPMIVNRQGQRIKLYLHIDQPEKGRLIL